MNSLKKLDESQVEAFNTEYVKDATWDMIVQSIDRCFPDGKFTFIDIGGGNGLFTDKILYYYPQSKGIVLDNSKSLIELNIPHPRKRIIFDSIENLHQYVNHEVDIVFFNWLLHHLVSDTYQKTTSNMKSALRMAKSILSERGFISIFENMYDGIIIDNLPGRLIFGLTSSKLISPLTKRLGANTAGCGVCFLSKQKWRHLIEGNGMQVLATANDKLWDTPLYLKLALNIKQRYVAHFWVR